MTELHNMSVPSRSVVTVQREELRGRRYRVAIAVPTSATPGSPADALLTQSFREDGAACALALLNRSGPPTTDQFRKLIALYRRDRKSLATLRQVCDAALSQLGLPDGMGFFVEEWAPSADIVPAAAAIAILAARSGPLYLPGRFEPSLITGGCVTLFFPL